MNRRRLLLAALLAAALAASLLLSLTTAWQEAHAQEPGAGSVITGAVYDRQAQPVKQAQVALRRAPEGELLAEALTQPDGRYTLSVPQPIPDSLVLLLERPHFQGTEIELEPAAVTARRGHWYHCRGPRS